MTPISNLPPSMRVVQSGVTFRCPVCDLTGAELFLNLKSPNLERARSLLNNTLRKGIEAGNRGALTEDLLNVLDWCNANGVSTPQTWPALSSLVRRIFA
jgi:hypothetical protein